MSRPRVGFLGVGWIGRHRMEAMLATGAIDAAAVCDPSPEMVMQAAALAPDAIGVSSLDEMLALGVDAVVIATPSALHAAQSIRALEAGAAVFCQKPLGRSAAEARAVVAAARDADRLLGVDMSYRFTEGMRRIAELIRAGTLGDLHAIDLVFHNAYGPDKPWFYDRALSGGGCIMDLGVHLVDIALWATGFSGDAENVHATLLSGGKPVDPNGSAVEDLAFASFQLGTTAVRLACSWRLHAGRDAEISATFYGANGGAALRNVGGSFYDFTAEEYHGTQATRLCGPPDAWGQRAAADWARRLAAGSSFDASAEEFVTVAALIDRIYAAG